MMHKLQVIQLHSLWIDQVLRDLPERLHGEGLLREEPKPLQEWIAMSIRQNAVQKVVWVQASDQFQVPTIEAQARKWGIRQELCQMAPRLK